VDGLDLKGSGMPATVPCAREAGRERTGCQGQRGRGVGRLEGGRGGIRRGARVVLWGIR
jgi:hypothetical protein